MSKTETDKTITEESPAAKLGVETITPSVFRRQIEILAGEDVVIAAVGPSGIGKTAVPIQVAKDRGVPYVPLHMPTMTPEDFHIPTMAKDTQSYYDRRIPRRFQEAIEFVEKEKLKHPGGVLPGDRRPIIAVEELNRAVDKSVTRGAFVLLGDRMIGDVHLDANFQFVVTMNPTGGGMAVNEFERDPAMRRRLCIMYVAGSYSDFMRYAEKVPFHDEVLGYLRAHPSQYYDDAMAKNGKVFACPATWERVSRVCNAYARAGHALHSNEARAAYAGYVGTAIGETFIEFVRDRTTTVTPDDVMTSYSENSETRKRMQRLLDPEKGRLDRVTDLLQGLAVRVFGKTDGDASKISKQIGLFMGDLPEELMLTFVQHLAKEAKEGQNSENRAWMQKLNTALNKEKGYMDAIHKYHAAKDRAKAEATAAGLDV
jgi:hypothetical protein